MPKVNVSELRNHLPECLARAESGEEILVSKGRVDPGTDSASFCRLALEALGVRVLPITPEIALASTRLDLLPGRPR